ncbi:MAG: hypothetical protein ACR2IB_12265 [Pyrinomonadaceae bacterium]
MPNTFHFGRGSDWDVAEGPYGTVGVDVPRNREDRSDYLYSRPFDGRLR